MPLAVDHVDMGDLPAVALEEGRKIAVHSLKVGQAGEGLATERLQPAKPAFDDVAASVPGPIEGAQHHYLRREEIDLPQKMARLRQWCVDATAASASDGGTQYRFVYVDQESFERHLPKTFAGLTAGFTEYQS